MVLATRLLENDTTRLEMGVDEVGRGPMFGRVYAGAAILPIDDEFSTFDYGLMKDSKKFTSVKKLEAAAHYIMEHAVAWAVGYEDEAEIDRINILQATQSSMRKAIRTVLDTNCVKQSFDSDAVKQSFDSDKTPYLLVDGNCFKPMMNPHSATHAFMEYTTVVGGDNKYCSIAAASILAKWHRDQYIADLCETYPQLVERYKINTNKGYGTKPHMDGIREHGITQWHRRTFGVCSTFENVNTII